MISIKERIYKWLQLDYYTSKIDKFLNEFDKNNPKLSASQREEKEIYARVYALRDTPGPLNQANTFWDNF